MTIRVDIADYGETDEPYHKPKKGSKRDKKPKCDHAHDWEPIIVAQPVKDAIFALKKTVDETDDEPLCFRLACRCHVCGCVRPYRNLTSLVDKVGHVTSCGGLHLPSDVAESRALRKLVRHASVYAPQSGCDFWLAPDPLTFDDKDTDENLAVRLADQCHVTREPWRDTSTRT